MKLKRKWLWEVTTFDRFVYIAQLDRFLPRDDAYALDITSSTTIWLSSHSRRFLTKRAMMRFMRSDYRCPRSEGSGWIAIRIELQKWGAPLCREWGTMVKKPT